MGYSPWGHTDPDRDARTDGNPDAHRDLRTDPDADPRAGILSLVPLVRAEVRLSGQAEIQRAEDQYGLHGRFGADGAGSLA